MKLSPFTSVKSVEGIYSAWSGNLRCCAIRLKDGGICLYSPVAGLSGEAVESLSQLGEIRFLLAPNHYHNKAITEFTAAFPNAIFCASQYAVPRLKKITGLVAQDPQALVSALPGNMKLLEPEGLKTGELWLRVDTDNTIAWLVVDAFCGPKISGNDAVEQHPELLKPFPKFGVGDRDIYGNWAKEQIRSDNPQNVVPCHGAILSSITLALELSELVDSIG